MTLMVVWHDGVYFFFVKRILATQINAEKNVMVIMVMVEKNVKIEKY